MKNGPWGLRGILIFRRPLRDKEFFARLRDLLRVWWDVVVRAARIAENFFVLALFKRCRGGPFFGAGLRFGTTVCRLEWCGLGGGGGIGSKLVGGQRAGGFNMGGWGHGGAF